ncbi:putative metal-binding motif-containing protein, partial [Myxococcota bacterium]|nr:putative metal-binding motif-containing protein [Myxococcota bacterium]
MSRTGRRETRCRLLLLVAVLAACTPPDGEGHGDDDSEFGDDDGAAVDGDGDGYVGPDDCDDANGGVHPGAEEVPYDGVDNDCDAATPDDDLDGDGR